MQSDPHLLGVRNPSSQASASPDCAADAETSSDPTLDGVLDAIAVYFGIERRELNVIDPHKPKVLTEAPVGATLRSEGRG